MVVAAGRVMDKLMRAERAVLILTRTDCEVCTDFVREVRQLLTNVPCSGVAVGELVLDRRGAQRFVRANPWMADLRVLPYTLLMRRGQQVEDFATTQAAYVLSRVRASLFREAVAHCPAGDIGA